jgi:hypothetical protein
MPPIASAEAIVTDAALNCVEGDRPAGPRQALEQRKSRYRRRLFGLGIEYDQNLLGADFLLENQPCFQHPPADLGRDRVDRTRRLQASLVRHFVDWHLAADEPRSPAKAQNCPRGRQAANPGSVAVEGAEGSGLAANRAPLAGCRPAAGRPARASRGPCRTSGCARATPSDRTGTGPSTRPSRPPGRRRSRR